MNKLKKTVVFIFLSVIPVAISAPQSKGETSFYPGEIWKDNTGKHINAHGGGIIYVDNTYYWFGEYKSDRTSSAMVGVTCYSSKDLYNWKNESVALAVKAENNTHDLAKGCILERPKVIYNKKNQKYVMFFHLELKGQGYNAARVGIAVSNNVTGPYTYIRSYRPNAGYWPLNFQDAYKEIKDTLQNNDKWFSPSWVKQVNEGLFVRRDFKGGQMSRDMTLYVDDDEKAYHIYSSEENLTIHIAELTTDYQAHTGRYVRVAPAGHNEAPAIFKKDGIYWMITSGCTGWNPNAARMFMATNIMGPWKALGNPCRGVNAHLTFDSQSTFIFPVAGKKDVFIFMADRWRPNHPSDARYIWLPIEFENGLPFLAYKNKWDLSFFNHNKDDE